MFQIPMIMIVAGGVLAFIVAMSIVASWFRKVGPNQALVVFGFVEQAERERV